MLKKEGFHILLASPSEYERLVAEIYFNGLFIAMVTEEKEIGTYEIEMPGPVEVEELVLRRVNLKGFLEAINRACARLSGSAET